MLPPHKLADALQGWQEPEATHGQPPKEADGGAESPWEPIDTDRIVALVAGLSESIDARLETLGRRVEAVEQQMREQAVRLASEANEGRKSSKQRREQSNRPDPAAVDDPRGAVDEGLRALTTGHRESGPGDEE